MRKQWKGFIETDGLSTIKMIWEGKDFGVWVDGDFDDSVMTESDFKENYGGYDLYANKSTYKAGCSMSFEMAKSKAKDYPMKVRR